ncbi:hypothetical protein Aab01nite_82640 [Paractinoplanes abujensis]|nr:hypothetical protein Aab01nite_82640 [Actinoplanes abujensis]
METQVTVLLSGMHPRFTPTLRRDRPVGASRARTSQGLVGRGLEHLEQHDELLRTLARQVVEVVSAKEHRRSIFCELTDLVVL